MYRFFSVDSPNRWKRQICFRLETLPVLKNISNFNSYKLNIKHLMTGPEGNSLFCFSSHSVICYIAQRRHSKTQCENKISVLMTLKNALAVKRYHLATFNHALITCTSGRRATFAGNSVLLPSDVIDFAMLPAQRLLTGNTFIVGCHVTLK